MCGINGILFREKKPGIDEMIGQMNNAIFHRGPDEDGMYLCDSKIAMAMRRLSIIDLKTGQQPIFNEAGDICIFFNGEIYNFKGLRAALLAEGTKFKTASDTEVVLKLYEKYGKDCLGKLNGMFALAIHDQKENILFIARDRFGEKPLYYLHDDEKFVWASELKSIVSIFPEAKKISKESLNLFFALTYVPAPKTIYQDVLKLMPGHYLTISTITLQKEIGKYWDIDLAKKADPKISYVEAKATIRDLLFDSVERRMIADVPLGVFLSGGVDSTIVAAIMSKISPQKIKTFTVAYKDKKYDESGRARLVADHIGSEHHEYVLDFNDLLAQVDHVVLNYDEPYADSSCLPTYFISHKTVQEVKVALTGDGGDEVFGGYNKYLTLHYADIYRKYVPSFVSGIFKKSGIGRNDNKSTLSKVRRLVNAIEGDFITNHLNIIALGFQQNDLASLISDNWIMDYKTILSAGLPDWDSSAGDEKLKTLRYIDKQISLEGDMLVKVDRASMLCSLECRAPFLDHRLMEYTYELPDDFLLKKTNKKRILKDSFSDLLPDNFFNAQKSGFEIPLCNWFRNELRHELQTTLSKTNLEKHGLLKTDRVQQLLDDHLSLKVDNSRKLWVIFCFQKWYLKNFS